MENEKDVNSYRKSIQRQRVHIFVAGLDGEFEQIHGEIMRKDPVPELEECYSMVSRESIRHAIVNGDLEKSKAAAMVSKYRFNQNCFSQNQPDQMRYKGINKSTYKSFFLKLWVHNRDSRRRNASKSSTVAIVETNAKEDVVGQSTSLVATRGNNGKALNSSALISFIPYTLVTKYISTANGSSAPIIGEGFLSLINNLNLDSVLVVPSLDYLGTAENQEIEEEDLGASGNQEIGEVSLISHEPLTQQATDVPNQLLPIQDVSDFVPEPSVKQLPPRHNRGLLKPTYEP
ncbi:hypothetical protein R3W88_014685 [Solanum pinnatisectum]|uniref:Uncharacterized protein n=1 Tax=Solanum pinnatisectum TaxID=50273 RepID=A0AAV9KSF9_9SOLN|nr:hypothetical protein R3W88_014685 [Solanum pinnatisectum]